MREIKFRGNRVNNGKWVYGLPLYSVVGAKVIIDTIQSYEDLRYYTVIPETVGQFTGLHDKNGKEIYEGDIVKLCDTNPILFRVEIILARYGYKTVFKLLDDGTIAQCYFLDKCEVVGNIHDNPELLKEVSHEA